MKKFLFLVLLLSNFFGYTQYTAIPDLNFEKALIDKGFDNIVDKQVLTTNISSISAISLHDLNISDLTGIQDFVSLTYLSCGGNFFTSLDISRNTALTEFGCIGSQLTNIDFSKNILLTKISIYNSKLTSIDISKNIGVQILLCTNNNLTIANLKNGNNLNLNILDLAQNPNLRCIEVDDKAHSDRNWSIKKDATASFSENCSKITSNVAPIITASGNQVYCPQTNIKIATSVNIVDPDDTSTDEIYIQISTGYIFGQDQLTLAGSHPTIATSWDINAGKLRLYSPTGVPISYLDFIAAIQDVEFNNSSTSPSGIRNFSISIGQANYLPSTQHYYEFIPSIGITWASAKIAAEASNYYGLKGYLATILAADEAQLSGKQANGAGWIGGSDAASEGTWRWLTGPEGLANGGAGTIFWNGLANGSTPNFAFWNTGEPNQTGDEDYAHITASGVGIPGSWNDLSNTGGASGDYQPKGYIVEYGGMPGDPILQISASTTITIPKITSTTASSKCDIGSLTLQATASDGVVSWYTSNTGGTPVATGNSFTTPTIFTTTSYFVDATNGNCPNGPRTEIIATIKALPSLPQIAVSSTSPVLYCLNATAIPLAATASTDCFLNWYTLPSGGIASTTSPTPITTVAGSTTYYVSQTNTISGCESPRAAIIVTVNPLPTAPLVSNVFYCNNEAAAALTAAASANCTLNWYTTTTGGTPSTTNPTPSTTTVGSTNYYVSQTITSTGCEGPRAEITVTINPLPTAPVVNNIPYCHNEIAIPLTATASANCTLNWYSTPTGGTSSATSPTPSTATLGTIKYYVSQTITATGCEGPRSEISVTINPLPVVKDVTIIQCDTDLIVDGKTLFNLTVNNTEISANSTNETFTYFTSLNGANNAVPADLIPNELAFENTTPTLMDIWSRITNKITGCHNVAKVTLKVPATNIPPTYKIPFSPVCDDFLDTNGNNNANNDKRDGISTFDFSATKAIIEGLLPTTDVYNITYYKNESDALSELNEIPDISNYRNIGYPNTQDIWIRIDSDLDNACFGIGPYLTLNVEALPLANTVIIPRQCDDNNDGIFTFNTSSLESDLLKGQTNVTVTYFDQANNPLKDDNGVLITSPFPTNFTSTSQTIKAVVTNNTPQLCFDETTITFIVDVSPQAFSVPSTLTIACDDEANPINQDGKFAFDTSTFETTILGGQTGMIVKYYDQNNVLLPSPLPNPFLTTTQNITAKVQNPLNAICTATTTLNFVVNPVPNIDLNLDGLSNELVCSNLSTFFVTLDAGITDGSSTSNYDYIWTKDGITVGTNSPTLDVNTEGVYTVEVTNNSGCGRIRILTVTASNIATIVSVDVVDLTDVNTVTVNTTGPGVYQYSIDEPNGFWQDSNFFNNVPAGEHVVYVNDKNGCGLVHQEIVIVGVPKYFTPNGDSYNDVWEIKGIIKYPQAEVQLFDRYGKYLTTLNAINKSWDGNYNGYQLPADDYWYVLNLGNGKPEIKGHFSLKR